MAVSGAHRFDPPAVRYGRKKGLMPFVDGPVSVQPVFSRRPGH
jgi:hypothetical protein